jgi:hypothetical protein
MIFGQCFLCEGIQFAGRGIRLYLDIPGVGVELGDSAAKHDKFCERQLFYKVFSGFSGYHDFYPSNLIKYLHINYPV